MPASIRHSRFRPIEPATRRHCAVVGLRTVVVAFAEFYVALGRVAVTEVVSPRPIAPQLRVRILRELIELFLLVVVQVLG